MKFLICWSILGVAAVATQEAVDHDLALMCGQNAPNIIRGQCLWKAK